MADIDFRPTKPAGGKSKIDFQVTKPRTPAFPLQAEEEQRQQAEMQENTGPKILKAVGTIVGTEMGVGVIGDVIGAARAAKLARRAAQINAEQDIAHIKQVAEAVTPYSWKVAGGRIAKILKDDADKAFGETKPGDVPWQTPGKLPPAPKDVTPEELAKADKAMRASTHSNTVKLLKNPMFWATVTGGLPGAWGIYQAGKILGKVIKLMKDE